jgi:hypothetical protein
MTMKLGKLIMGIGCGFMILILGIGIGELPTPKPAESATSQVVAPYAGEPTILPQATKTITAPPLPRATITKTLPQATKTIRVPGATKTRYLPGATKTIIKKVAGGKITEDSKGFDCRTMGNRICGPGAPGGHRAGCYAGGHLIIAWGNYADPQKDPLWGQVKSPC